LTIEVDWKKALAAVVTLCLAFWLGSKFGNPQPWGGSKFELNWEERRELRKLVAASRSDATAIQSFLYDTVMKRGLDPNVYSINTAQEMIVLSNPQAPPPAPAPASPPPASPPPATAPPKATAPPPAAGQITSGGTSTGTEAKK